MRRITVRITDSQPNDTWPALDVYFPAGLAERLGWKHEQPVEMILDSGQPWHGTVGTKPWNRPYLHRRLTRSDEQLRMREWLLAQGLADGAVVELIQEGDNRFRWGATREFGEWAPGRAPSERIGARPQQTSSGSSETRESHLRSDSRTFPFSDPQAVLALAGEYWDLIREPDRQTEFLLEEELPKYRELGHLNRDIFMRIARWKSPRPTRFYEKNTEDDVIGASARAFRAQSGAEAAAALESLAGVRLQRPLSFTGCVLMSFRCSIYA